MVDVEFSKHGGTIFLGRKGFQRKGKSQSLGSDSDGTETAKFAVGVRKSKYRGFAKSDQVSTDKLTARDTKCGTELGCTGIREDIANICTVGDLARLKIQTISRMVTCNTDSFLSLIEKGAMCEREIRDVNGCRVSRNRIAALDTLEMLKVGRKITDGNIVHAFIKASMFGDFNVGRLYVLPENVLGGAGQEGKKNAFAVMNR